MVFYYITSKLQPLTPIFTRTFQQILSNNNPCPNNNHRIIRNLMTTTSRVNHNHLRILGAATTLFPCMVNTAISTTVVKTAIQHKSALQLKGIMTKFGRSRASCIAMLAMCFFLRVERVPFSDRLHLVLRSSNRFSIFSTKIFETASVKKLEKLEIGKVLPATHCKTLRVASVARKLGQAMHDVLGLKRDFNIVTLGPDNESCRVWNVQQSSSYTRKKLSSSRYSTNILEGRDLKIITIDSPYLQAATITPTNIVFVCTELLDRCSDEELAFVIGHEMGHAIGRHHMDNLMWFLTKQIFKAASMTIMSLLPRKFLLLSRQGRIYTKEIIPIFPRRRREYEADHIGMMLMAASGYDPRVAPTWLSKYATTDDIDMQPYYSHPRGCDRIEYLKNSERMNKAMDLYRRVKLLGILTY